MNNSVGDNNTDAGAVSFGGTQAASAQFQVGSIGFGPMWETEDSMAESIVRISRELEEAQAQIAVYEAERTILQRERDGYASHLQQVCEELGFEGYIAVEAAILARAKIDKWRECAKGLADAVDYYHPALRDVEDGFSAERAAIARFDELEGRL